MSKTTIVITHDGDKCSDKCRYLGAPSDYTDNRCMCELFGIRINKRTKLRNKYCKYITISELERRSQ